MVNNKTPALFKAPVAQAQLAENLAEPNTSLVANTSHTGAIRKAIDEQVKNEFTPGDALKAMKAARDLTDVPFYVRAALEILRRDPNLQSVLQTRVLALSGLTLVAEQVGKKLQERKAAEFAQEVLESEAVEGIVPSLALSGIYLGFAVAQNYIDSTRQPWNVFKIEEVPAHFFVFDRKDGQTPLLLPQEMGGTPIGLEYGKFIVHRPGIIPGNPVTSGIAYTAMFYYALKYLVLKDWTGFVELYGQPIRVGKYPQGIAGTPQGKKDLQVLKTALRDLGGDAWAMLPESMQIEIVEAATRNGSAEVYERLCRFLDEQLARLVLGGSLTSGTGNTGAGGSQALGSVHNEVRTDILKADAKALAVTLRRHLIRPLIEWNFGEATQTPRVYFHIEEPEDVAAKVKAICDLVDRGWTVPVAELHALLDVREPEGDEPVIGGQAATTPATDTPTEPTAQQNTAQRFSASQSEDRDELDDLLDELVADADYQKASADADAALLTAIEGAKTFEDLKAALIAAVQAGSVEALRPTMTTALTAAGLAGAEGVEVGEK